ncbi:MAG TPA: bifunctional phosphoribosylaminoimidazolecarboxamide formyltransferase/IMP cyclohydrolase [Phycisphaerales bacterium]|nr:bifunctional phosphoribosylaminoimidazolecarboxamide formyltransferase/IMP cyclohydrolase [Phycisphaerales bacterium]
MTALIPIRRAILSVSDKTDLIPFARALADLNVQIISTGGTAAALRAANIDVTTVDAVTGFPEIMDGRVKTLHPAIHGALLGRRDLPSHMQAMQRHSITPIDLVCVNLYPFERTMNQPGVTADEVIEQIDIGGPSMLRSAAKNHRFVTVVTNPEQYDSVIAEMRSNDGATSHELRRELAAAAFARTAEYDTAISAWMSSRRDEAFPQLLRLTYAHHLDLRYGENPHQQAALYVNPASAEPSVVTAENLHGKELSYNNILDGAAALELVQDLHILNPGQASAAIIKHTNPCGAAVADSLEQAYKLAHLGDPLAAYGGILALSRAVDEPTARAIAQPNTFLEIIIAPRDASGLAFQPAALELLKSRWQNVRLLAVSGMSHTGHRKINYRSVPGGMLVQDRDMRLPETASWQHVAGPAPSPAVLADAAFLTTVGKHVKSNAIAIGGNNSLFGIGCGQVDRLMACKIAIEKSAARIRDLQFPVASSDAFFPFPDGPELLINAGVKCIVHPGGSKRDSETIDLCNARNVTCLTTSVRHFRH